MTHMAPSSNRIGRSPFKAEMSGSSPVRATVAPSTNKDRWPHSQCGNTGSNPVGGTKKIKALVKNTNAFLTKFAIELLLCF